MGSVRYKSNLRNVLNNYDKAAEGWLEACGKIGLESIIDETPVNKDINAPTRGNLKKNNKVKSGNRETIWYNETPYASFVEFGTYKMNANPFMRRGILKKIAEFTALLRKYFQ